MSLPKGRANLKKLYSTPENKVYAIVQDDEVGRCITNVKLIWLIILLCHLMRYPMAYMQSFTEGSGELAMSDSGERRGEFAAAKVTERIKIIAEDSATLEYAKTTLTKSPVRLIMCTYM